MDGFRDILEELSLVDVKTGNGWFTWSNNREGANHVKERLDRFLVSEDLIENLPFISTNVVRQSKSDHEEILLNTHDNKPIDKGSDYRTCFKYDVCWAKDQEARDLISRVWNDNKCHTLTKMNNIREKLGPWQYQKYRRMKYKINELEKKIDTIFDGTSSDGSLNLLKEARGQLGQLYDEEERYWAQRARNQWLRKGDRNTRYFHVRLRAERRKIESISLKTSKVCGTVTRMRFARSYGIISMIFSKPHAGGGGRSTLRSGMYLRQHELFLK
ncbi:uncharacterized protein LOC105775300 [Gossypium raimondii]|uniref:uncharacterized protein LOC105775300 n=1 Tax=Gossypium raimondii TaxID=29730 RepID=UPI00227D2646|nr:uncharacterized protein LOC105775300 [Gossypium raimondii]